MRKTILNISFFLFVFCAISTACAQPGTAKRVLNPEQADKALVNRIVENILSGDADELSKFFNSHVEVSLIDERSNYAKNQARLVMKQFFSDYPPSAFSIIHQGHTGGTSYALGEYRSIAGTFEVNIFLKTVKGKRVIDKVRFEKK